LATTNDVKLRHNICDFDDNVVKALFLVAKAVATFSHSNFDDREQRQVTKQHP
jgi:hypothetical protein